MCGSAVGALLPSSLNDSTDLCFTDSKMNVINHACLVEYLCAWCLDVL